MDTCHPNHLQALFLQLARSIVSIETKFPFYLGNSYCNCHRHYTLREATKRQGCTIPDIVGIFQVPTISWTVHLLGVLGGL